MTTPHAAQHTSSEEDELAQLRERVACLEQQLGQLLAKQAAGAATSTSTTSAPASERTTAAAEQQQQQQQPVQPTVSLQQQQPLAALPLEVPMGATRIVMTQIVAPSDVDVLQICRGGQVLSWIDVCAGLAAKTLAHGPCVTVSVDAVHFFRPCKLGDVVMVAAMVNRTFSTSMEVGVRVEAEEMSTGLRRHCCSAYLTFVSLKAKQQAAASRASQQAAQQLQQQPDSQQPGQLQQHALSRVCPHTSEQQRIYAQAEARRQQRLAARQAAKEDPHKAALLRACRLVPVTHREGGPTLPPPLMLTAQDDKPCSRTSSTSSLGRLSSSGAGGELVSPGSCRPPLPPGTSTQQQQQEERGSSAAPGLQLPRQVRPGATTVYSTHSIMPHHANTLNITFGGQVLSWMEQCAYLSASRLRGAHHLTASMDGVNFATSTKVGDILYVISEVTAIFDSSLEVMISVFGETPSSAKVFHCADAFATIVVVDATEGRPTHVPWELQPATEEERLRLEGAQERRAARLAMRSALAAASSVRPSLDSARS